MTPAGGVLPQYFAHPHGQWFVNLSRMSRDKPERRAQINVTYCIHSRVGSTCILELLCVEAASAVQVFNLGPILATCGLWMLRDAGSRASPVPVSPTYLPPW